MKDLKHIYLFEKLLDQANNELVKKAIVDGNIAIGYTCFSTPEVLLNLPNAFGVRMRAPNTGSMQLGTYYISNMLCGMSRALVERGLERGFNFLSAISATETCSHMNRSLEQFELLNIIDKENFFMNFLDVPLNYSDHGVLYYANQIKEKILKPMSENYGIDISKEAVLDAVKKRNRLNKIMAEIASFRKKTQVVLTGTEMHILNLVVKTTPIDYILPYLEETLEELKQRKADEDNKYRARIIVVGSEMDDYKFTELMEMNGALVVGDRYCFGTLPGYEHIDIDDNDPVISVAKYYLKESLCPRFMSSDKKSKRKDVIRNLCEEYHADGILFQSQKFCDYWGYERTLASEIAINEDLIPSVCVELSYTVQSSGQLKTRIQAFVENLEIKRINKGKKLNESKSQKSQVMTKVESIN